MSFIWKRALPCLSVIAGLAASPHAADAKVLQVGTYLGVQGGYSTIQDAVNAAAPGDWVLVAPGDYHEQGALNAGVLITTPGIHLRGPDRSAVIVDGTKPGAATCSAKAASQQIGGTWPADHLRRQVVPLGVSSSVTPCDASCWRMRSARA